LVVGWLMVLPATQREQRLRWEVEEQMKARRIDAALATLSAHEQKEFPPHWDPPPRPGYGENEPPLLRVVESILERPVSPWVRAVYLEKFEHTFLSWEYFAFGNDAEKDWPRVVGLLERLPEGPMLKEKHKEAMDRVGRMSEVDSDKVPRAGATRPLGRAK